MPDLNQNSEADSPPASFIVPMWAAIFQALGLISLLQLLRRTIPWLRDEKRAYAVVETWVVAHTVLALCATLFAFSSPASALLTVFLVYGALRVLEIVITQANILLFDEWRARRAGRSYALRGYRRILILLLHNYVEILLWFVAALIGLNSWSWLVLDDPSLIVTVHVTLLSMVTFSTEGVKSINACGDAFLTLQSIVGVFMTILVLARFLSLMPTPATQESTERE